MNRTCQPYPQDQASTSKDFSQLFQVAVGNVVTAPIGDGIKLNAMGELHGFPPMKLTELTLRLEPVPGLIFVCDESFACVCEVIKLDRVPRFA